MPRYDHDYQNEPPERWVSIPVGGGLSTKVDVEDARRLDGFSFGYAGKSPWIYARVRHPEHTGPEGTYLHRFLMQPGPGIIPDHINDDGLDNRRQNLQLCTIGQNTAKRRGTCRKVSPYRGVKPERNGWWSAWITVKQKKIYLGFFPTAEEAATAFNMAALRHHRQFAKLNMIPARAAYSWATGRSGSRASGTLGCRTGASSGGPTAGGSRHGGRPNRWNERTEHGEHRTDHRTLPEVRRAAVRDGELVGRSIVAGAGVRHREGHPADDGQAHEAAA